MSVKGVKKRDVASNGLYAVEAQILDLWDAGRSKEEIYAETGLPKARVDNIISYLGSTVGEDMETPARLGSADLLRAIARAHPKRILGEGISA